MEKIIILKGASNRGKTLTLRYLIEHLINEHKATIVYGDFEGAASDTDCFVILDIPELGNVGVITFGDTGFESMVKDALYKCNDSNCTAVVAASHMQYKTSPNGVDSVYKLLWDFGQIHMTKTVETTTIVKYDGWGKEIDVNTLNRLSAVNLSQLLFNL